MYTDDIITDKAAHETNIGLGFITGPLSTHLPEWISTSIDGTTIPLQRQTSTVLSKHRRQDAYPFLEDPEAVSRHLFLCPSNRKSFLADRDRKKRPRLPSQLFINILLTSLFFTAAAMCPPVTVVSASTASLPVVAVWPVVNTTTVPTSTSSTPVTSVRSVCVTSTRPTSNSGSPLSTLTRYVTPYEPIRDEKDFCGLVWATRSAMATARRRGGRPIRQEKKKAESH